MRGGGARGGEGIDESLARAGGMHRLRRLCQRHPSGSASHLRNVEGRSDSGGAFEFGALCEIRRNHQPRRKNEDRKIHFLTAILSPVWDKAKCEDWIKLLIFIGIVLLSQFGDWAISDVLWPFFMVIYKDDKIRKWYWFGGVCVYSIVNSFISMGVYKGIAQFGIIVAALILMFMYNGERGSGHPFHKWFFYVFYPLHLFVLAIIRYDMIRL